MVLSTAITNLHNECEKRTVGCPTQLHTSRILGIGHRLLNRAPSANGLQDHQHLETHLRYKCITNVSGKSPIGAQA